jgi:hypothetical protein
VADQAAAEDRAAAAEAVRERGAARKDVAALVAAAAADAEAAVAAAREVEGMKAEVERCRAACAAAAADATTARRSEAASKARLALAERVADAARAGAAAAAAENGRLFDLVAALDRSKREGVRGWGADVEGVEGDGEEKVEAVWR